MQRLLKKNWNVFFVLFMGLFLVSCGNGGSSGPGGKNITRPIAHAGADQTVRVGRGVMLDGSSSSDPNGDALVLDWVFVSKPEGSEASLSDSDSATPSFIADKVGDYVVMLTVTDGNESAWDTVTIYATVTAPVAKAGPDQVVHAGTAAILDGSGSLADGETLTFAWVFVSKPEDSQASLSNAAAANPSFEPDKVGAYGVKLTVTDGHGSAMDTVTIHATNTAPVARASLGGSDVYKKAGDFVVLDGSGSRDDDGDPLTFAWSVVSWVGEQPELTDATSEKATMTAGNPGPCGLRLDVSDGYEMDSSFVALMVFEPTNPVPDTGQTGNYTETFGEDSDYNFHPHSYTRLKANGEERTGEASWVDDPWFMVRDNVTGLIWEVKGGAGSINDKTSRYLWADTSIAIAALNSDGYGGYKDWRMPTIKELSTLVHSGRKEAPFIDVAYFPNTQSFGHWSSTSDASYKGYAWRVHFDNGGVDSNGFSPGGDCVRAVRGGQ